MSNAWKKLDLVFRTLEKSAAMKHLLILAFAFQGLVAAAQTTGPVTRIAFGSGLDTDKPQPIWSAVAAAQPELFVLLGSCTGTNPLAATNCEVWSSRTDGCGVRMFGSPGKQVQVILLNVNTSPAPAGALLDADRWTWYREQLRKPAQVRIVASDIPVVSGDHQGAKWADWPRENARKC